MLWTTPSSCYTSVCRCSQRPAGRICIYSWLALTKIAVQDVFDWAAAQRVTLQLAKVLPPQQDVVLEADIAPGVSFGLKQLRMAGYRLGSGSHLLTALAPV